ncbi:MAG: hypothetical protein HDT13_04000 [Butyrivibrio sp.]|nr:hypothetical protein [Butyrivibrio sp.]
MKMQECIRAYFKKLNTVGIMANAESREKIINRICKMPEDMLNDLDNSRLMGIILDDLGYPSENNDKELSVYSFDTEVFSVDSMYTDFLNCINILTKGELQIEVIKEDISKVNFEEGNGIQTIEFKLLGEEYRFNARAYYDWFDVTIIGYLNEIVRNRNQDKSFYITGDGWQNCIVFYNTDEWADKYNKIFPELMIEKV